MSRIFGLTRLTEPDPVQSPQRPCGGQYPSIIIPNYLTTPKSYRMSSTEKTHQRDRSSILGTEEKTSMGDFFVSKRVLYTLKQTNKADRQTDRWDSL